MPQSKGQVRQVFDLFVFIVVFAVLKTLTECEINLITIAALMLVATFYCRCCRYNTEVQIRLPLP